MKTVLITGVNGFLGSHLAGALDRRGWRVRGTVSGAAGLDKPVGGVERKMVWNLAGAVPPDLCAGVDAVVHSAYDLRRAAMEQNVGATERLAEAAAAAGVAQQVFIGSYSAHAGAASAYGRTKFILQEYFIARGHAVARPGLVIGPGGMFERMAKILRLPVVPVADGGRDRVPVVALADFSAALAAILEQRRAGLFNLFNPDPVTLGELLRAIRAATGSRTVLAPVPAPLVVALSRLMEKFGVPPPFDAENIAALKANQNLGDRSDLGAFVPAPLALAETVEAASREIAARRAGR